MLQDPAPRAPMWPLHSGRAVDDDGSRLPLVEETGWEHCSGQAVAAAPRPPLPSWRRAAAFAASLPLLLGGAALVLSTGHSQAPQGRPSSTLTLFGNAPCAASCNTAVNHHILSRRSGKCLGWGSIVIRPEQCSIGDKQQLWSYRKDHHIHIPDGRCLDEGGDSVHVWSCSTKGAMEKNQHWSYDASTGQIRHVAKEELCLSSSFGTDHLDMKPCDAAKEEQQWSLHADEWPQYEASGAPTVVGQLRHWHGICLDAGGHTHMWPCNPSNVHQHWQHDPSTGQIKTSDDKCLDDIAPALIYPCNASLPGQRWTLEQASGQLKGHHGKCLTAPQPGTTGSWAVMKACNTESRNQQWNLDGLAPSSSYGDVQLMVIAAVVALFVGLSGFAAFSLYQRKQAAARPEPLVAEPEAAAAKAAEEAAVPAGSPAGDGNEEPSGHAAPQAAEPAPNTEAPSGAQGEEAEEGLHSV
mmetsp:Transcript_34710/g.110317  ORF Transcript_34710/g.110317 Transcript_34710/m.110317 type:complete len:467 (+) Transcript_34710:51-1451(+)